MKIRDKSYIVLIKLVLFLIRKLASNNNGIVIMNGKAIGLNELYIDKECTKESIYVLNSNGE